MEKINNIKLAFLYNIRHQYPDVCNPQSHQETDFDYPQTINTIIKHLKKIVKKVIPIEANKQAYLKMYKYKKNIDLVLNYAEGINGRDRESHIPAMLEMLQIPYTGCSPLSCGLILDKARCKEILSFYQIPVLPHQIFNNENDILKKNLNFPLIVKPVDQGSSAGITNESIVYNKKQLKKQLKWLIKDLKFRAFVEPFLTGREFSVSMLGNPPNILPIIEPNHSILPKKFQHIDSLEVKWLFEESNNGKNYLTCPAKLSLKLKNKIYKICREVWNVLKINDVCRVDIRCDQKENPYVLEINFPPGMIPPEISMSSYLPLSARVAGIDYDTLLSKIISSALKRYENIFN